MQVTTPFEHFFDTDGSPLDGGFVYIGVNGLDAESNPQAVYFDKALTIPAAQPIATLNGYPVRMGSPAVLYVAEDEFSVTVKNKNGELIYTALYVGLLDYDNSSSGLDATNYQAAIDEIVSELAGKVGYSGGVLTGHLSTVSGASGAQVPQAQEIPGLVRAMALGTVSHASGVPTGAIIERGSNTNGSYVRFADGTQIVWKDSISNFTSNIAQGSVYFSAIIAAAPHPAAFSSTPFGMVFARSDDANVWASCTTHSATNRGVIRGFSAVSGVIGNVGYMAIGRWF